MFLFICRSFLYRALFLLALLLHIDRPQLHAANDLLVGYRSLPAHHIERVNHPPHPAHEIHTHVHGVIVLGRQDTGLQVRKPVGILNATRVICVGQTRAHATVKAPEHVVRSVQELVRVCQVLQAYVVLRKGPVRLSVLVGLLALNRVKVPPLLFRRRGVRALPLLHCIH
jgi:hypothetical protein